jgi:hypothetical protein
MEYGTRKIKIVKGINFYYPVNISIKVLKTGFYFTTLDNLLKLYTKGMYICELLFTNKDEQEYETIVAKDNNYNYDVWRSNTIEIVECSNIYNINLFPLLDIVLLAAENGDLNIIQQNELLLTQEIVNRVVERVCLSDDNGEIIKYVNRYGYQLALKEVDINNIVKLGNTNLIKCLYELNVFDTRPKFSVSVIDIAVEHEQFEMLEWFYDKDFTYYIKETKFKLDRNRNGDRYNFYQI